METIKDLKIGTVIRYNDRANLNLDYVILDHETNEFGSYVRAMDIETKLIELMRSEMEISERWKIVPEEILYSEMRDNN